MAARDRYQVDVTCKGCSKVFRIGVSEDDYRFMSSPRRAVDYADDGCTAKMRDGEVFVTCGSCGHETQW